MLENSAENKTGPEQIYDAELVVEDGDVQQEKSIDISRHSRPLQVLTAKLTELVDASGQFSNNDEIPDPQLPNQASELKVIIDSFESSEKALVATGLEFWKVLDEAVRQIKAFELNSIDAVGTLQSSVSTAIQAVREIRRNENDRKILFIRHNGALERYKEAILHESGFSSYQGVGDRIEDVRMELHNAKWNFLGLGRWFSKDKVATLAKEEERLNWLNSQRYQSSEFYHNANQTRLEEAEGFVAEGIHKTALALSRLSFQELSKATESIPQELLPEDIDRLNETYVDQEVRTPLSRILKDRRIALARNLNHSWGQKADRDEAINILRGSFGFDMNSNAWNSPPAVAEKREAFRNRISALPYSLQTFVRDHVFPGEANQVWMNFNNGARNVCLEAYQKELDTNMDQMAKQFSRARNYKISGNRYRNRDKPSKPDNFQPFGDLEAMRFDLTRWKIFRTDPVVKERFGETQLNGFENVVKERLISELCQAGGGEHDYGFTTKLIGLKSVEACPLIILDAFRVSESGRRYLLSEGGAGSSGDSKLFTYLSSLRDGDIEILRRRNIPGLTETIDLIKANKDDFSDDQVRRKDGDSYDYDPNPVYEKIQSELDRISAYFIEKGSEDERHFAFRVLKQSRRPLGVQALAISAKIDGLKEFYDYSLSEQITSVLSERSINIPDLESLEILLKMSRNHFSSIRAILCKFAYSWDETAKKVKNFGQAGILPRVTGQLAEIMPDLIKQADVNGRVDCYMAAKNLGINIRPDAGQIVDFIRAIFTGTDRERRTATLEMAGEVTFNDDQVGEIAGVLTESRGIGFNLPNIGEFIANLPVGPKLSEVDKRALLGRPDIMGEKKIVKLVNDFNGVVSGENWVTLLSVYSLLEAERWRLDEGEQRLIRSAFSNEHPENRNFCLAKLDTAWNEYLNGGGKRLSVEAKVVCENIKSSENEAGDLKYVTALVGIMNEVGELGERRKVASRTVKEIVAGFGEQEERMKSDRWSEDDRATFYNLSKSVLEAAPSLYSSFQDLFAVMSARDMEMFLSELFPLYQANLVTLETGTDNAVNPRRLVPIRRRIEEMARQIADKKPVKDILEKEKSIVVADIQATFKTRFGLIKIPEVMTEEHIRTLKNCTRYVGNIAGRDKTKEAIVSLYMGLTMNDKWLEFRAGKDVNLGEYFEPSRVEILSPILEERGKSKVIDLSVIGLSEEMTSKFAMALQGETISNMIGNVQTIDVKLGLVKRNLEDLTDPDIYADEADRAVVALLREKGVQAGPVLSKLYAESSGKKAVFSAEETNVRQKIEKIFGITAWTPTRVKEIQNRVQVPSLICGILRKIDDEKVDEGIARLQSALTPTPEIIEIFNSFGEEFKVNSGAMAISQDLAYLENIIVKNSGKITPEKKAILDKYLGSIRTEMSALENVYTRVKETFAKMRKGAHESNNAILKSRLDDIDRTLSQSDSAVAITTRVTANLNLIVENMRQCLGCLKKEINNDTNLAFGDGNKFFLMSQGEKEKGSIADEIAFFVPVSLGNGQKEMSFVLDRVYGSKSSDVMMAHLKASTKKFQALRKEFPGAKISIFVTDSALSSVGLTGEQMKVKIEQSLDGVSSTHEKDVTVTVPVSVYGDNYIEFGGDVRTAGDRPVSGLRVAI